MLDFNTKTNRMCFFTVAVYIALFTLAVLLRIPESDYRILFSFLSIIHILLLYIIAFPQFKYIIFHYAPGTAFNLYLFHRIVIEFKPEILAYLFFFFSAYFSTLLFKKILYNYRIGFTMKSSAPQLKPLLEKRLKLEKKLGIIREENADLENAKILINKIYNQVKILNSKLELAEILDLSGKILKDTIEVNNFVIFIRDENNDYSEMLSHNLTESMEDYLLYLKKKGNSFFGKITSFVKLDIDPPREGPDLDSVNLFPFTFQDEILGFLVIFETGGIHLARPVINNIKIIIRYFAMAVKKSLLYKKVQALSQKDGLTSLYLRRVLEKMLEQEFLIAKRYKSRFSLIMLDIDHFKEVNDRHGHLFGDRTLQLIAEMILKNIEAPLTASRYGGEEFVVICPNLSAPQAWDLAEKIRKDVEGYKFLHDDSLVHITISAGVAEFDPEMKSRQDLVKLCDKALYRAKNEGRNRVIK